ncbi:MAG: hypothetical protein ABJA98_01765 [Acidobacteriota bacterium]
MTDRHWVARVATASLTGLAAIAWSGAVAAQATGVPTATTTLGAASTVIAAAIVTVIAALVGGLVSVINAVSSAGDRRAGRMERAALLATTKNTDQKADTIIEKATEIHTLTNSNLSKVTTALELANERIHGLEKLMAAMLATHNAADIERARLEQPPQPTKTDAVHTDFHEPVKVEVVNTPLETTAATPGP